MSRGDWLFIVAVAAAVAIAMWIVYGPALVNALGGAP